jgi:hypothetical protein
MSDYPKTMRHPAASLAVVGQRTVDAHGQESYGKGTPDRLPPVTVDNEGQEQEYRAKGYVVPGEAAHEPTWQEYRKWVGDNLVNNEQEEQAARAEQLSRAVAPTAVALVVDDKIATAASCIAGKQPVPPWLMEIVTVYIGAIRSNHETRDVSPTRTELRERLEAIRLAADVLAQEFKDYAHSTRDYAVIPYLQEAGLDQPTINELSSALPRLAACATKARAPDAGRGNYKTFLNERALTTYEMCSALVVYGWRHARGKDAPHASKPGWRACEAIWQAAGLPERSRAGGGNESLNGWRDHLQNVKSRIDASVSENSTDWQMHLYWQGLEDLHSKSQKSGI